MIPRKYLVGALGLDEESWCSEHRDIVKLLALTEKIYGKSYSKILDEPSDEALLKEDEYQDLVDIITKASPDSAGIIDFLKNKIALIEWTYKGNHHVPSLKQESPIYILTQMTGREGGLGFSLQPKFLSVVKEIIFIRKSDDEFYLSFAFDENNYVKKSASDSGLNQDFHSSLQILNYRVDVGWIAKGEMTEDSYVVENILGGQSNNDFILKFSMTYFKNKIETIFVEIEGVPTFRKIEPEIKDTLRMMLLSVPSARPAPAAAAPAPKP